jgi:epoxide hydrolase-like predicted phosphatase
MTIRAVIWDLGGVLVRTEDYSGRERLARRLGKSRLELEELVFSSESALRAQAGELNDQQHWEKVRRALSLFPAELSEFQKDFWSGDRLDVALVEVIRNLRPKYKTGLLSNHFPSLRDALRNQWKIEEAFDVVVISAEVGLLKPDARIFRLVLTQLGVFPSEAVFIDDFARNLAGAEAVGMQTLQFRRSDQLCVDLQHLLNGE